MEKPLVFSFVRFSSAIQRKGDSVRRQEEARKFWLEKNKLSLDDSRKMHHEGSAFRGAHRKDPDKDALAAFIRLVDAGDVPTGSFLIVENLDRLTRENTTEAAFMVLGLLKNGIKIVQLLPTEVIWHKDSDPMLIMMMIMELSRGHSESRIKSERLLERWKDNRAEMIKGKKKLGARCPAWLIYNEKTDSYKVDEAKAQTIKTIFGWAEKDLGVIGITQKLVREKVPCVAGEWKRAYIVKLLKWRVVLGEYTPRRVIDGKLTVVGDPIKNYYPTIIDEGLFNRVNAAIYKRNKAKTRITTGEGFLFAGKVSSVYGDKIFKKDSRLIPYSTQNGTCDDWDSFPANEFEDLILDKLAEIDSSEILTEKHDTSNLINYQARLTLVEQQIERIVARSDSPESFEALLDLKIKLQAEKKELQSLISLEKQKIASPLASSWGEYQSLAKLKKTKRGRLKSVILNTISEIMCLFVRQKVKHFALVTISFNGSSEKRSYVLLYRRKTRFNESVSGAISWKGNHLQLGQNKYEALLDAANKIEFGHPLNKSKQN